MSTTLDIYEYILRYHKLHGKTPTYAEMTDASKFTATSSVTHHINKLIGAGLLKRAENHCNRRLNLTDVRPSAEMVEKISLNPYTSEKKRKGGQKNSEKHGFTYDGKLNADDYERIERVVIESQEKHGFSIWDDKIICNHHCRKIA